MSEEKKVPTEVQVEEKEKRERSAGEQRTQAFKAHLQAMIKDRLDVKVSRETAWNMFKDMMFGTLQFVVCQEDKRLPLSGVGTFEVIKAGARGKKKEEGVNFVPKYRFYPSTTIEKLVCDFMGQTEGIPEEVKFLGSYNTEDALDKFTGMTVANAEWLAKMPEKDEAPVDSEEA